MSALLILTLVVGYAALAVRWPEHANGRDDGTAAAADKRPPDSLVASSVVSPIGVQGTDGSGPDADRSHGGAA